MKTNPILLAVSTLTLAAPAVIHSAQSEAAATGPKPIAQPDSPRAGLVTIVDITTGTPGSAGDSKRRIAWKSLAALPTGERDRLLKLVRLVDRANPPRAPRFVGPACMD